MSFFKPVPVVSESFWKRKTAGMAYFLFLKPDFQATIEYFDHLGLLDEKTLLVHCVHVTEKELQLIKERGSHICLCPGSNQFLGVGSAPVEQMLSVGLLPALGTDSPASNHAIGMWREMQILKESHPNIDCSTVLAMATIGGSKALHYEADFGSLAVGKKAQFIHVSSPLLKVALMENSL